jgi:hypothetical protein
VLGDVKETQVLEKIVEIAIEKFGKINILVCFL